MTDRGVFFLPCDITKRDTYTQEEWGKIKRLVGKGIGIHWPELDEDISVSALLK